MKIKVFLQKGFTLVEITVTLLIFSIICFFAVPPFVDLINKSRTQAEIVSFTNFLRSAQQTAIATNRTVLVYPENFLKGERGGYQRHDNGYYWSRDWLMVNKPLGNKEIFEVINELKNDEHMTKPEYIIAKQKIFSEQSFKNFNMNILYSYSANMINFYSGYTEGYMSPHYEVLYVSNSYYDTSADGDPIFPLEGYNARSMRGAHYNGVAISNGDEIKNNYTLPPMYFVFKPNGNFLIPAFVFVRKAYDNHKPRETAVVGLGESPMGEDAKRVKKGYSEYKTLMTQGFSGTSYTNESINRGAQYVTGIIAACSSGPSRNVDEINYVINQKIATQDNLFESPIISDSDPIMSWDILSTNMDIPNPSLSFNPLLCGSDLLN